MAKTYKDLEIYKESFDLFLKTHRFTLILPKHELYELGSQLRRSSDSINSNIVEGYGRNKYLKDFIRFLTFAYSSNNETINQLKKLENLYTELILN
jgi:four helix bundle protein